MSCSTKLKLPNLHLFLLAVALLLGNACKEKKPPKTEKLYEDGVFIVNEGNFQGGNASLGFLDLATQKADLGIFEAVQERPLGDVAQSMTIRNQRAWLVVNNSGKIEVMDLPTLAPHCTLTGLTSPRYLHFISDTKAYVTDLYSKSISIVDPSSCALTGSIATGGWTEGIVAAGGFIWVAQTGTNKVLKIDPNTDQLLDSILVGRAPVDLLVQGGKLLVLCNGGLQESNGLLTEIVPTQDSSRTLYSFPNLNASPSRLRISPSGQTLYWLYEGAVYTAPTSNPAAATVLIPPNNRNFYGLEVDPDTGNLYVLDARDFVQSGQLLRYTPSGQPIDSYATGIIPSTVVFY